MSTVYCFLSVSQAEQLCICQPAKPQFDFGVMTLQQLSVPLAAPLHHGIGFPLPRPPCSLQRMRLCWCRYYERRRNPKTRAAQQLRELEGRERLERSRIERRLHLTSQKGAPGDMALQSTSCSTALQDTAHVSRCCSGVRAHGAIRD